MTSDMKTYLDRAQDRARHIHGLVAAARELFHENDFQVNEAAYAGLAACLEAALASSAAEIDLLDCTQRPRHSEGATPAP